MKEQGGLGIGRLCLTVFVALVFVFLLLPTLLAVPMSFSDTTFLVFPPKGFTLDWYENFFTSRRWTAPTWLSLKLATITTLVSLVIGIMASLALVRGKLPGKRALHIFILSPMMTPLIVTGFAVYGLYARMHLIGTTLGMVIAHVIICVPYVILVVTANLYRFDLSLERAARSLGAGPLRTFRHVTLPLILPGVMAGAIFSFIESLDELVLVLFLIGTKKMTLPLRMFSEIQFRINPTVAAASTVFIIAAIGTVMATAMIQKKEAR